MATGRKRRFGESDGSIASVRIISPFNASPRFPPSALTTHTGLGVRSLAEGMAKVHRDRRDIRTTFTATPSPRNNRTSISPFTGSPGLRSGYGGKFDANASIVLVGIRGTGKSSLGIIASTALRRRFLDADQYFLKMTGTSRATFRKDHGVVEYRLREVQIMRSMLMDNESNCIIACGPGCVEGNGQLLLREYAKTHPVIHIVRDANSIQQYLQIWEAEKITHLIRISEPMHRACSNLEFYNLSELSLKVDNLGEGRKLSISGREPPTTPFLTLKHVEEDFLRFLRFLLDMSLDQSNDKVPHAIASVPPESRLYTYALCIPLSVLATNLLDFDQLDCGADAVELNIDLPDDVDTNKRVLSTSMADLISRNFACLKRSVNVPIIYHVESRTKSSMPNASLTEDAYFELLQHGLRLCSEYITVDIETSDEGIRRLMAARVRTKVIGHFYDPNPGVAGWSSEKRLATYNRAKDLGCDIVRLSQPAISMEDNAAVQRFIHQVNTSPGCHPPIIAYNVGRLGRTSLCFNPILTPVTFPSLCSSKEADITTCITIPDAQKALYASFVLDPMHFYVLGASVSYSLSPAMHNAAYKACGMPHDYRIGQASSLSHLNTLIEDPNFGGAAIALPFKTEVIALLHSMSSSAKAIGAVNTLIPIRSLPGDSGAIDLDIQFQRNHAAPIEALYGDNTDWIGIRTCIRRNLSPANTIRPWSTALVLGAGGMARAAIYALKQLGICNVFVWNRTPENADKLAHYWNSQNSNRNSNDVHDTDSGLSEEFKSTGSIHETCSTGGIVTVLRSLEDPWPAGVRQPTAIVSCIPAHSIGNSPAPNITVPAPWLQSSTGGVVIEVGRTPCLIACVLLRE
ncbi:hypothetical protein MMC24_005741 [Lignoscripta atroalba]|nr:hypothetical protein [Lignoscripta atroalba]